MGTVVVDAGVVIGWLEVEDAHHVASARALRAHEADDLRLPASAYAEALVRPVRLGRDNEARAAVEELGLRIDPVERAAGEHAALLRARHPSLRLPDALVLGHAAAIGADTVLTTDARWSRVSPNVEVV